MSLFVTKSEENKYYQALINILKAIDNVSFTPREIDVIACILNGRTAADAVASFLSIESRTVEAHKKNYKAKLSNGNIRDLVELSDSRIKIKSALSDHYSYVLAQDYYFQQKLQLLKKKSLSAPIQVLYFYDKESDYLISNKTHSVPGKLSKHLADIQLQVKTQDFADESSISNITNVNVKNEDTIILVISHAFMHALHKNEHNLAKKLKMLLSQRHHRIICLIHAGVDCDHLIPAQIKRIYIQNNYYMVFLELLQSVIPPLKHDIEKIMQDFKSKYVENGSTHLDTSLAPSIVPESDTQNYFKNTILSKFTSLLLNIHPTVRYIFALTLVAVVCYITFIKNPYTISNNDEHNHTQYISSDLVIPADATLLKRNSLIHQIDNAFQNNSNEIKIVALVGIGGAGKTTTARLYARGAWSSMIWEINAESPETLRSSFENLALTLANTEHKQQTLQYIQKITLPEQRESSLINFVKQQLKLYPNWLLIFDNVDDLAVYQKYLPQDSHIWGNGKVLITTRDSNIHNNHHISDLIDIGILDQEQKLTLFTKIINEGDTDYLNKVQPNTINQFLEAIPPFPLDVSTAAYYLRDTKASFEQYIGYLNQNNPNFNKIQGTLLKEIGIYTNTRYNIISLSLEQLISTDKDFADLMLLITLLDSQNIPTSFLYKFKNSDIVDYFLHQLRRYSLITHEELSHLGATFSLHRSTKDLAFAYLAEKLSIKQNKQKLLPMINFLGKIMDDVIDKEDIQTMQFLLPHYEALFARTDATTAEMQGIIGSKLGSFYYYLGNPIKATNILSTSIEILNKHYHSHYEQIAQSLLYEGSLYASMEDFDKSRNKLTHSLKIYQTKFPETHPNIPLLLLRLGYNEQELGNYSKALTLFESSLNLYQKHHATNHARIARALTYLGNLKRKMCDYTDAKVILERSLEIYTTQCPDQHYKISVTVTNIGKLYRDIGDYEQAIHWLQKGVDMSLQDFGDENPWHLAYLGNTYRRIGKYKEAHAALQKSYDLYIQHAPQNYIDWISIYLGGLYSHTGHLEKAKNILEPCLVSYTKMFGENSVKTAWVLMQLGYVYSHIPADHAKAQPMLEKSLAIYQHHFPNKHIKVGVILKLLGNNYMSSGDYKNAQTFLLQAQTLYEDHFGAEHYEIAKILTSLGTNALLEGHLEEAQDFLNKALEIFHKNNYTDIYTALETMSDLYLYKAKIAFAEGNHNKFKQLKLESYKYLNEALTIINEAFPEPDSSAHIIRIKDKISASSAK